ncbi:MAG: hypothetical protein LBT62_06615, partial [Deltaproteobacteria bacterium]|nr:hypothetical protein [Deltaproteobacteria bacterium]
MSRYGRYSGYGYFQYRPKVNKDKFFKANPGCKPVVIDGQTIAKTFWGQRWCRHFDGMADYANRLARGRTYARNGSVCHLDITAGKVEAVVAGSDFYKVNMDVKPLPLDKWNDIKKKCHGQISTIVDLLLGRFSPDVMEIICDAKMGMFPNEDEISFNCSCPDWAQLCKHIGAVFCSIGNRLDQSPELLFLLRRVDPSELLEGSAKELVDGAQGTDADAL